MAGVRLQSLLAAVLLGVALSGMGAGCPPQEPVPGGATLVTWIPSEAAPGRGIVVRLLFPERPRYPEGTAAVVEVPGRTPPAGWSSPGTWNAIPSWPRAWS